jgi:hypothetical protein
MVGGASSLTRSLIFWDKKCAHVSERAALGPTELGHGRAVPRAGRRVHVGTPSGQLPAVIMVAGA